MTTRRRRKCRHCGQLFRPDPRNLRHQRYPDFANSACILSIFIFFGDPSD